MSELINNNSRERKDLLKHMILQLHEGVAPEEVKKRLVELLSKVPYGEVVEVEQELISEGLPEAEVLRLCDVHSQALEGVIDLSGAKIVPPGHPVDTFKKENRELEIVVHVLNDLFGKVDQLVAENGIENFVFRLQALFNSLMDVDKHYRRKENLLFPFLEKYGITGPPTVMWGKHNEIRSVLKNAVESLTLPEIPTAEQLKNKIRLYLQPAVNAIPDMILKEEEILFPMCMDKLTEEEWYEIYEQTNEIGYCLFDPVIAWAPSGISAEEHRSAQGNTVRLPRNR